MATIKDLKKRIGSVKNTQQTTKAMKLVSAAKLRRSQDAIVNQRPYAREIASLMASLIPDDAVLVKEGAEKATLVVVVSSDRGLCGGYNANIFKAAAKILKDETDAGRQAKFVLVGRKANEILKSRLSLKPVHFEEFGAKPSVKKSAELAKRIRAEFDNGTCDRIVVIYNEFKNVVTQITRTDQLLPIDPSMLGPKVGDVDAAGDTTIYAPSKRDLFNSLEERYLVTQLYKVFLDGQASEHGARMSAMENATKNAGEMIRKLTLQYNKQRQAAITKELLEIIAGSESQKAQA